MARRKKFTHPVTHISKGGRVHTSGWFGKNPRSGTGFTYRSYKRRKGMVLGNTMGKFVKGLR